MIRAVVFDLDGVLRHFAPEHVAEIEADHGLLAGSIHAAAFAPALLDPVITGRVRRADWVRCVGERIGCPAAAARWGRVPSTPDAGMLALSDDSASKLVGADALGIRTHRFTGIDGLRAALRDAGVVLQG